MSVLQFPQPVPESGYLTLTDFEAWFLCRRLQRFTDPLAGAPISAWLLEFLTRTDIQQKQGRDLLFGLIGREGQARIAWQDPRSPDPTPFRSDQLPNSRAKIRANDLKLIPVPVYLLSGMPIYAGGNNALVGASGTGKSFVGVHVSAECACSLPQGRSVVYLAFEGLHGYSSRWEAWKAHHRKDTHNLIFYGEQVNFMVEHELTAFIELIRPDLPALVVVDTVARSMTGYDENATRDMGVFVAAVERVRRELGCTMLLIHHTNKQGGMRGNSSLYNACDSVIFLKRVGAQIELHNDWESGGKNKHRQEESPRYLRLLPKSVQAGDQTFESAVLVDSDMITRDPDFNLKPSDLKILQSLVGFENGLPPLGIAEATGISKSTIYRNLQPLAEHGYITQTKHDTYVITERGNEALNR